ncbi:MAG: alpha-L-fucosidase [Paludibacteraceae bacterium]|nr:alpha-L-fucosidase [Paludibacteraceae bacterium]
MKIRKLVVVLLLLAAMQGALAQNVEPTWESLNERGYPSWFDEAKLGIFIHWGLYSVPAYAHPEGYAEWLYKGLMGHSPARMGVMANYGDTTLSTKELYAKLTDYWHAELWSPTHWAEMFKDAGAKYVVLVTKHHDGYCLWDSPQQSEWNSVVSGPKRNIVGELTKSIREVGLRMCFYYSLPEWSNPLHRWTVDPNDSVGRYVDEYMVPQFKELVTRYKPDLIFSDGDWDFSAEMLRSKELISFFYNTVGSDAIVNNRWGGGTEHGFLTPEYSAGIQVTDRPWAECRGLGRSFGLNRNELLENIMTSKELIQHFAELVANGGGMTLNVGPNADGTIPFVQQDRLRELGRWLKVNGEAIYGSRPMNNDAGQVMTQQNRHASIELERADVIDYDWVRNAPVAGGKTDCFEVIWEGEPEVGRYALFADADDEAVVTLNGDTIANGSLVDVRLGDKMRVHYYEKELEARVRLCKIIAGDTSLVKAINGWSGVYKYEQTIRAFTMQPKSGVRYIMEFERPGDEVIVEGFPRIEKGCVVTLLGCDGKLKWRQSRDGKLIINLKGLDRSQLNALDYVWVFNISR